MSRLCFALILLLLQSSAFGQSTMPGVGALGKIEPRSRVLKLSHNQGAEGARLWQLNVTEGQAVTQGEVLALLADHEKKRHQLAARKAEIAELMAEKQKQQAEKAFAETEYRRYRTLAEQSSASRSLADQKRLNLNQANAELKRLTAAIERVQAEWQVARTDYQNTEITAPIAGTVVAIHTRPGERIGDEGILELADLTQLDVVAEVHEADLARVEIGQIAKIQASGLKERYTATVRERGFLIGKNDLNDTDPLADRDTRVVAVRLTLAEPAIPVFRHQLYRQVQVKFLPTAP